MASKLLAEDINFHRQPRRSSGAVGGNNWTPAGSVLYIQLQESVAETVLLTGFLRLDWQH